MRKFFGEHPLFSIILSSCLVITVLGFTFLTIVLVGSAKVLSKVGGELSKASKTSATEYVYVAGNSDSENKLLYIPITGEILTTENKDDPLNFLLGGFTYGYTVKEELMKAAKDESVKGVILGIDSPGGTVTGAKAIYDGVEYYKNKSHNPVIAHISGLGVSGSYMAALPADKIISDEGSLIGSIGVIMGPFKYYDKVMSEGTADSYVTTENGVYSFNIYAGENKDLGDPYKQMPRDTYDTLQKGVNNEYDNFVKLVSGKRGISEDTIKKDIKALVYDVKTAQELKLIDEVTNREESYVRTAEIKGLPLDDFQVVSTGKSDFWSKVFSAVADKNIYLKEKYCPLCGQVLYLYGSPTTYSSMK